MHSVALYNASNEQFMLSITRQYTDPYFPSTILVVSHSRPQKKCSTLVYCDSWSYIARIFSPEEVGARLIARGCSGDIDTESEAIDTSTNVDQVAKIRI